MNDGMLRLAPATVAKDNAAMIRAALLFAALASPAQAVSALAARRVARVSRMSGS